MVNKIVSNKRKARVRKKLKNSSSDRMRLSVFRSSKHIYAQIIDDTSGVTIASASTLEKSSSSLGSNISSASKVGSEIAKKAIERKTGARGLRSILEQILMETMYEVPSEESLNKVVVDSAVVRGETEPLMVYQKSSKSKTG